LTRIRGKARRRYFWYARMATLLADDGIKCRLVMQTDMDV
jgi:hypothetical protein